MDYIRLIDRVRSFAKVVRLSPDPFFHISLHGKRYRFSTRVIFEDEGIFITNGLVTNMMPITGDVTVVEFSGTTSADEFDDYIDRLTECTNIKGRNTRNELIRIMDRVRKMPIRFTSCNVKFAEPRYW